MAAMTAHLIRGDARRLPLATGSVQAIVTSPPYMGLRAYQTTPVVWGGRSDCEHVWTEGRKARAQTGGTGPASTKQGTHKGNNGTGFAITAGTCTRCGAWRGELGSEPTPALFVAHLVEVMRECWRVLRDDGVCFVNMGDSMAGGKTGRDDNSAADRAKMDAHGHGGGVKVQKTGNNGVQRPPPKSDEMELRSDLTPEERAYVLAELAKCSSL